MRATLATQEEYDGAPRKLAWFSRVGRGFYFEAGAFFLGSHTSYHVDGNVFRTSPATEFRARFRGTYVPLSEFRGWYQLGIAMVRKNQVPNNPPVKAKDRKPGNLLATVSMDAFKADNVNIVVELLHMDQQGLLDIPGIQPPADAIVNIFEMESLLVVTTVLGSENNLLVWPITDGFSVRHINSRYSSNLPGVEYRYEAYGDS